MTNHGATVTERHIILRLIQNGDSRVCNVTVLLRYYYGITTPFFHRDYFFIERLGRGWPGAIISAINYDVFSSKKVVLAGAKVFVDVVPVVCRWCWWRWGGQGGGAPGLFLVVRRD